MPYKNTALLLVGLSFALWQCQPAIEDTNNETERAAVALDSAQVQSVEGADASFLEKKSREGVDFYAIGNEPSWSLDIFQEHMISFKSMTEVAKLNTPKITPTNTEDRSVLSYRAEVESGTIMINVKSEACTDLMSGEQFPYSVEVLAKNGDMADFREFNGCGRYVTDYRLSGTWKLVSLAGVQLNDEDISNPPTLTLDIANTKVTGSNGCNRIMGTFINEGSTLRFPMLAGTRMACPGDLDTRVDELLNSVTQYQIEGESLIMKIEDIVLGTWLRQKV